MDEAYPGLHTVPPRPQLSYTIEQKRAIADALVSDRENARYTGDLVRYRTGLSSMPPPPRPVAASDPMPQIVGAAPAIEPVQETAPVPPDGEEGLSSDDGFGPLDRESAELDDGSLDDFVRDLVRETEPVPAPGTLGTAPDEPAATADTGGEPDSPPPAAGDDGPTDEEEQGPGPLRRVLGWLGGLFGGNEDAAGEASGGAPAAASPPAAGPSHAPGTIRADQNTSPKAGLHRPTLKPDESADPPAPAPAKPLARANPALEQQASVLAALTFADEIAVKNALVRGAAMHRAQSRGALLVAPDRIRC